MTKNHTNAAGEDHALLAAGTGWEHRGRQSGPNIAIELWRREERLELSRTGLRHLLVSTDVGPDERSARDRALIEVVARGILVLRDRDGIPLTNEQAAERARNIVTVLVGEYYIESFEGGADHDGEAA